jgi:hypothetical protein
VRLESVAESFANYRARVLPPHASEVQVVECRRAFYAGVYILLANLATALTPETDDDAGVEALERLKAECEAFAANGGMPLPHATPPEPPNFQTTDDEAVRPIAKDIGRIIAGQLPDGWGFTLLLFTFGPGGALSYISNADRSDMLLTMKEFITRQTQ